MTLHPAPGSSDSVVESVPAAVAACVSARAALFTSLLPWRTLSSVLNRGLATLRHLDSLPATEDASQLLTKNTEVPGVTPPLTERPGGSPAGAVSVLPRSVPADARPRPAPPPAPPRGSGPLVQVGPRPELGSAHQDGVGPEHKCFTYSLATIYCLQCYLTGALASDGVVEGAVEEAGVRMVLLGATPCRAHRILCLCPGSVTSELWQVSPTLSCHRAVKEISRKWCNVWEGIKNFKK